MAVAGGPYNRRMRAIATLRNVLVAAALLAGLALSALLAQGYGERRELRAQRAQMQQQLELHARGLRQLIDRYRALPQLLALDPELRAALAPAADGFGQARLNLRLEAANRTARASTLTLIDRSGVALAASNWREASSNVGRQYGFRPYVQQALQDGQGRFYGIGVTTGEPGYFLSEAVRDDRGDPVGVVVIKIDLAALEREWLRAPDTVLVSDEYGVAFLSSRPAWRYRMLRPLDPRALSRLAATRKYEGQRLLPFQAERKPLPGEGDLLVVTAPAMPGTWLRGELALPDTGWTLHLFHDASAVATAGRRAAIAAAAAWLALAFLALFVLQRRRMETLRRRNRADMERLVQQHASEMRTARDALTDAAQKAETGLSKQLEHLPQGVVIVDAGLNLVAWNARYVELFRFPPELMRVGAPIERLLRFNAQRGLLGGGPVEVAIRRRLEHLRSGRPHMHESEKEDGTVLEIRGNPLPDGGFVTSYADITSYKNTARELRSLADALEQRIERRTADLDQARREAVDANRYKTRFVAAAVHDLLQPLNAARMFLSALRSRLQAPEQRELSDHVDAALAAQDAVLTSLLDISRMEAGTQQVDVRGFALGPLLEALAREFGMLARARGLELAYLPTSLAVRSDEALLRRILQNLLSNAVRYTRRGRILLGCRRTATHVRIEVHDQGQGIPEDRQREIFEEFRRLGDGNDNDRGAGLGLAIVERIGRLLGHPIGLSSQPGRGSVFWVTVPLGEVDATAVAPATVADAGTREDALLTDCVSWCIDDDPRACEATRALLQRWGCRVPFAGGPARALDEAIAGEAPQLVLLDVRMGDWHGPDLYRVLCDRWRQAPPVILVTAERDETLRRKAAERGWGFLAKPVRAPALRALMSQLLLRHR